MLWVLAWKGCKRKQYIFQDTTCIPVFIYLYTGTITISLIWLTSWAKPLKSEKWPYTRSLLVKGYRTMVQKMNICKNTIWWLETPAADFALIPTSRMTLDRTQYHGFFHWVKVAKVCEADHWPSPTAQVKNEWSYTSASPTCLHSMNRFNFTWLLYCCCHDHLYHHWTELNCSISTNLVMLILHALTLWRAGSFYRFKIILPLSCSLCIFSACKSS